MKSALDVALTFLSRRALTRYELEQRLLKKEYSMEDIDSAVLRLSEWGYLNDLEYAKSYCRTKQSKYSRKRIEFELKRKGVDEDFISKVLAKYYPPTQELELCLEQALRIMDEEVKRWERSYKFKKSYANISRETFLKQKVSQRLFQKGYSQETIHGVVEKITGR